MTLIIILNSILAVGILAAIATGHLWAILTSDSVAAPARGRLPLPAAPDIVVPRPAIA
jgi:hypothetical protein